MFTGIQSSEIDALADKLVPLIEKPLKRTDAWKYYTPWNVLHKCRNKDWQCWVAMTEKVDCVFITYISEFPTGYRSFVVYLVGGEKINTWLDAAWNTLKEYAKAMGCKEINWFGRKGWTRALESVEKAPIQKHLRFSVEL